MQLETKNQLPIIDLIQTDLSKQSLLLENKQENLKNVDELSNKKLVEKLSNQLKEEKQLQNNQIDQLQKEHEKQMEQVATTIHSLEKEKNQSCQEISNAIDKINQLETEKKEMQIQMDLLIYEKNDLINQLNSQINTKEQLLEKIRTLEEQNLEKNNMIESLKFEKRTQEREIISKDKDIDNQISQTLIEELMIKLKIIEDNYQLQQENLNLQKEQDQNKLDSGINQLELLNKLIENLQNDLNNNLQIQANVDQNIMQKNQQIMKMKQEKKEFKIYLEGKLDEYNNALKQLDEITNINEKIYNIIDELENQKSEVILNIEQLKMRQQNIGIVTKVDQKVESKPQQIVSLIDSPYEIIYEYTKQQEDWCYAIAFNKDQSIMVAGCGSKIIVFEFNQGQLNQKQLLSGHTGDFNIYTLYFMTKNDQFISGTYEQIGIWSYNDTTQEWYCLQLLEQAHSNWVNRVIMNKNEDLIISCSNDKTIKFWIRKNEWECSQIITKHTDQVYSICLNESCTQLVSCGCDSQIIIFQKRYDQKWTVKQSIQINQYGYRICFIDDNIIVFQPENGTTMETYHLNQQNKQFIKSKDIEVQNDSSCHQYFPMQFNNNKQLLLNKNGYRINLIRKQNNELIVEQSINFNTRYVYGAMANDFQYLVTYDFKSLEFQVRKQK